MTDYSPLVLSSAQKYGVDPALALSVYHQESGAGANAGTSSAGASGQMQLMPATAAQYGADPADPAQNIDAGVRYLGDQIHAHRGDVALGLASYNAGPGKVAQYGGVPPYPETRRYVSSVMTRAGLRPPSFGPSGGDMTGADPQSILDQAGHIGGSGATLGSGGSRSRASSAFDPNDPAVTAAFNQQKSGGPPSQASGAFDPNDPAVTAAFHAQHPGASAPASSPQASAYAKSLADARARIAATGGAGQAAASFANSFIPFGLGPNISGAEMAAPSAIQGGLHALGLAAAPKDNPADVYRSQTQAMQESNDQFHESHPISSTLGDVAGFLAPGTVAENAVAKAIPAAGKLGKFAVRAGTAAVLTGAGDLNANINNGQTLPQAALHAAQTGAAAVPFMAAGEGAAKLASKIAPNAHALARYAGAVGGSALAGGAVGGGLAAVQGGDAVKGAENYAALGALGGAGMALRGAHGAPGAPEEGVALDLLQEHLGKNGNPDLVSHGSAPAALAVGSSAPDLVAQAASEGGQGGRPVADAVSAHVDPRIADPRVSEGLSDKVGADLSTLAARANDHQAALEADPTSGAHQAEAMAQTQTPDALRQATREAIQGATEIDPVTASLQTRDAMTAQRQAAGGEFRELPGMDQPISSPRLDALGEDPRIAAALKEAAQRQTVRQNAEPEAGHAAPYAPALEPLAPEPAPADTSPRAPRPGTDMTAEQLRALAETQGAVKRGATGGSIDLAKINPEIAPPSPSGPRMVPTGRTYQEALSILGKSGNLTDPAERAVYAQRYRALGDVLNKEIPGLGEARQGYADSFRNQDAYERGQGAFGSGKAESAPEIAKRLAKQTPEENYHEARGVIAEANRRLETGGLKPEHILGNERVQATLKGALGEEKTARLNEGLEAVKTARDAKAPANTPDAQFKRGRQDGASFWSSPQDKASFAQSYHARPPLEQAAVKAGYLGELNRRLAQGGSTAAKALQDIVTGNHQGAIEAMFGPAKAKEIKALADRELDYKTSAAKIIKAAEVKSSSPTESPAELGGVLGMTEGHGGLLKGAIGAISGHGVGALHSLAKVVGMGRMTPKVRTALGHLLAQPAAQVAEKLQRRAAVRGNLSLRHTALGEAYKALMPGAGGALARGGGYALQSAYPDPSSDRGSPAL